MEVKKGYKQTEVGVIPEDWEVSPLSVLTTLMTNGFVGTAKIHYTESDEGILYIQGYNVEENDFNFNGIKRVSPEFHKKQSKSCLRKGDLLTVQTGDVGLTTIVPKELEGSNCHALIITRFKKERLNSKFFAYYLNSAQGRARLKEIEIGTTMKHINVGDMLHFLVPLPPTKAEQTAIAAALSNTDALIQSLEKLIAKKRNIKQGAMQELLKPKEGWVVKKLVEVAVLKARIGWQGLTTAEYKETGDYYLITGTDFQNGFIDWENCFYVEYKRYKQDKNIQVKENDVLVTKDGTIGKVAFIKHVPKPATLNSGVFVIRPIEQSFYPEFFYYLLLSEHFVKFLSQLSAGSTINHLYQKDFVHFEFKAPKTNKEQTRIATILADVDAEISALETKLAKYKQIKQGMMQNLLTGKIRLV